MSENPKVRSTSMIAPRNAIPEVMNTSGSNAAAAVTAAAAANASGGPKRHNLKGGRQSNSVDNLTPVKPRVNHPSSSKYQQQPGSRRARDLEQHLRDKYGLPSENSQNLLRRASSHSSLTPGAQYPGGTEAGVMRPGPPLGPIGVPSNPKAGLIRRNSFKLDYGPKSLTPQQPFTHLHQHHLSNVHEARDSKLRYLGRMSPEEQVDKYLKSVEKVNAEKEARIRKRLKHRELSMHLESHTDYRTTFDPSKHITSSNGLGGGATGNGNVERGRINSSITSRWHSLDSVSRPVLAKNVNNIIRKSQKPVTNHHSNNQSTNNNNKNSPATVGLDKKISTKPNHTKPPAIPRQVHHHPSSQAVAPSPYHRERTDLPKSFASMPQIGVQVIYFCYASKRKFKFVIEIMGL